MRHQHLQAEANSSIHCPTAQPFSFTNYWHHKGKWLIIPKTQKRANYPFPDEINHCDGLAHVETD